MLLKRVVYSKTQGRVQITVWIILITQEYSRIRVESTANSLPSALTLQLDITVEECCKSRLQDAINMLQQIV